MFVYLFVWGKKRLTENEEEEKIKRDYIEKEDDDDNDDDEGVKFTLGRRLIKID